MVVQSIVFLNSATLIYRGMDISKCLKETLGIRNNECRLYFNIFQQSEIEQIEKSERIGGAQQHKRVTAALNKQIQQQTTKLEEVSDSKEINIFLFLLKTYEPHHDTYKLQRFRQACASTKSCQNQCCLLTEARDQGETSAKELYM